MNLFVRPPPVSSYPHQALDNFGCVGILLLCMIAAIRACCSAKSARASLSVGLIASILWLPKVSAQDKPIGVLFAAGDIARCVKDKEKEPEKSGKASADLITREIDKAKIQHPDAAVRVLALGDLAYNCGATSAFNCFDETWGLHKQILLPVPGNHEYQAKKLASSNYVCAPVKNAPPNQKHAKAYFKYFEKHEYAKHEHAFFYSLRFPDKEKGPWLLVGLNPYAGISVSGLKKLLSDTHKDMPCVLAFSHAALYSSGRHGHGQNDIIDLSASLVPLDFAKSIHQVLYGTRASLFVAGHDHHYEQLGRANAEAKASDKGAAAMVSDGVRTFIVGTGGTELHGNDYKHSWKFREAYDLKKHGVLKIELYPKSYKWEFIPTRTTPVTMVVTKDVNSDNCNRQF